MVGTRRQRKWKLVESFRVGLLIRCGLGICLFRSVTFRPPQAISGRSCFLREISKVGMAWKVCSVNCARKVWARDQGSLVCQGGHNLFVLLRAKV